MAVDDSAKHLLINADTPAPRLRLGAGAGVGPGEIREFCPVDDAGQSLLRAAMRQLKLVTYCRSGKVGAAGRALELPEVLAVSRQKAYNDRVMAAQAGRIHGAILSLSRLLPSQDTRFLEW